MKRFISLLSIVLVLSLITAGCTPATPEVVEKEVVVEKPVVETVVVEKEVVVEKPVVETVEVEKEVVVEKKVVETVEVEKEVIVEVTPWSVEDVIVPGRVIVSFALDVVGDDGWITPEEIEQRFGIQVSEVERLIEDAVPGQTTVEAFDRTEVEIYDWSRVFVLYCDEAVAGDVESVVSRFEEYLGYGVDFVHPDVYVTNNAEPNDTHYKNGNQWHLTEINAPKAWDIAKGKDVVIAITERDGVDTRHDDLKGKVIEGGDVPTTTIHGTMVAGVAAAETNNNQGVAGVAWDAKFMPFTSKLKGKLTLGGLVRDIKTVVKKVRTKTANVRVINMSWQIYQDRAALRKALREAHDVGVVLVASAGNDQKTIPYDAWPQKYDFVIAVGATDKNDKRWNKSNYGEWLDVMAPGVDIVSTALITTPTSVTYVYASGPGTSYAAPQVAGLAALLLSQRPDLKPAQVKQCIEDSAQQVGGYGYDKSKGTHKEMGHGRIDAFEALKICLPKGTSDVQISLVGNTLSITSTARAGQNYIIGVGTAVVTGTNRPAFAELRINISGQTGNLGEGTLDASGKASVQLPAGKQGFLQIIVCPKKWECLKGGLSPVIYIYIP